MIQEMSTQEKEAINFMAQDYKECYEQLRVMDNQIIDIIKFLLSLYVSIIGVAIGLSNYFGTVNYDYLAPVKVILFTVFIVGFFILWFVLQRRILYVKTTRYLNEQRRLFLGMKPFGFANESRMHVDINQETLNWHSSHLILAYIIAILNGMLLGTLIFISIQSKWTILYSLSVTVVAISLQILFCGKYLKRKDKKGKFIHQKDRQ